MTDFLPFPPYVCVCARMRTHAKRGTGAKLSSVTIMMEIKLFSQLTAAIDGATDPSLTSDPVAGGELSVNLACPLVGELGRVVLNHLGRPQTEDALHQIGREHV